MLLLLITDSESVIIYL